MLKINTLDIRHKSGVYKIKPLLMKEYIKSKIFIVDEDIFSLNIYEQHIKNIGFLNVHSFTNATDCLNSLYQQPAIIFIEHVMSNANGIEVLKKIKAFNPDIYIVSISGESNCSIETDLLQCGVFEYIQKGEGDLKSITSVLDSIYNVQLFLSRTHNLS